MPDEFRRVTFKNNETRDAIKAGPVQAVPKVPVGDITSVSSLRKDNSDLVEFVFFDFDKKKNGSVQVDESVVKLAIIEFCLSMKIPLPRQSEKTLRIVDDKVCLDIFMGEIAKAAE